MPQNSNTYHFLGWGALGVITGLTGLSLRTDIADLSKNLIHFRKILYTVYDFSRMYNFRKCDHSARTKAGAQDRMSQNPQNINFLDSEPLGTTICIFYQPLGRIYEKSYTCIRFFKNLIQCIRFLEICDFESWEESRKLHLRNADTN